MKSEKDQETDALIDSYINYVKRARFKDEPLPSVTVARKAAEILRTIVTSTGRTNIDGLLQTVRQKGRRLSEATPFNLIIDNVTRRVMYIIREEYEQILRDCEATGDRLGFMSAPSTPCLAPQGHGPTTPPPLDPLFLPPATHDLADSAHAQPIAIPDRHDGSDGVGSHQGTPEGLTGSPVHRCISALNPVLTGMMEPMPAMRDAPRTQEVLWTRGKWKGGVISHINEFITDLGETQEMISSQAKEHLYDNDVVLVLGYSSLVEGFLRRAAEARAKQRKGKGSFEVYVAEGTPGLSGHTMAKALADAGIQTTIIPDSAIYALMCRINKVILGAYAVLADGGIVAPVGTHMTALAAKAHRAPVVVLAGLYKLSPVFPVNPKSFAVLTSPAAVLPYKAVHCTNLLAQQGCDAGVNNLHVRSPLCDYVPPALIHTYVTNNGVFSPSYVYRFLAEMYNPEDYDL